MINDKVGYFNNNKDKVEVIKDLVYINDSLVNSIGEGVDGKVYRYKDKVIKLYHDDSYLKGHLTKKEIDMLSKSSMNHIVLPREGLVGECDNLGFVMEYVDLSKKKNIWGADKNILVTEVGELEQELFKMGKEHFLLDDIKPHNLFYDDKIHMFDPDSFEYCSFEDYSKQNVDIFSWQFIKYLYFNINKEINSVACIRFVRKLNYLYDKGNYSSISDFLEDILCDDSDKDVRLNYVYRKVNSLNRR